MQNVKQNNVKQKFFWLNGFVLENTDIFHKIIYLNM